MEEKSCKSNKTIDFTKLGKQNLFIFKRCLKHRLEIVFQEPLYRHIEDIGEQGLESCLVI